MAENHGTGIEWTHRPGTKGETWNPIVAYRVSEAFADLHRRRGWYCEHASTGCINCYSETQNETGARGGTKLPYKPGHRKDVEIKLHEATLLKPLHWREPRTIFVCSMTDLYGEWVTDEMLDRIKAVQALTPQHTYIELTKRAERMRDYCSNPATPGRIANEGVSLIGAMTLQRADTRGYVRGADHGLPGERLYRDTLIAWPLPNVWKGTSAEDQPRADERIPLLLQTPAAVRFVSLEPLLGPIDLMAVPRVDKPGRDAILVGRFRDGSSWCDYPRLDWVIVGGESGSQARPMHPDWALSLRDQCEAAGVEFFFKQWGGWKPHKPVAGGDLGGDVRAGRVRIVHPTGQSDVEVSIATGGHNTIPGSRYMARVGKTAAGRLLDGRTYDGFPEVHA